MQTSAVHWEGLQRLCFGSTAHVFGACEVTYSERITMANRPGTQTTECGGKIVLLLAAHG